MDTNLPAKIKILIIEDDEYMQHLLLEFLNGVYDVRAFNDTLEGLNYLQNGNLPDLIIADLNTPRISGLQLISQLKASNFFKLIPVIIISGDGASDKRIKCLNAGADDYIVKPFNPAELEARIRVVLKRTGK